MAKDVTRRGSWDGSWDGGRIWRDADGKGKTYWIRRRVNGKRYEINTGCSTSTAAQEHLRRFEADPAGYRPERVGGEPIILDGDLAARFLAWSLRPEAEGGAGNTRRWVTCQRLHLAWWARKLGAVDLRRLTIREITTALDGAKSRAHRIAVIKRLYSWLCTVEHTVSAVEDPTYRVLPVPQARPAQLQHSKAVPVEHVRLGLNHLGSARWRDLLVLLAGTGMHVAEAGRFAASGRIEPLPKGSRGDGAGVVVIPRTKGGEVLRVRVSAEVLAAAERVLAAGGFDERKLDAAILAACKAAGIPPFHPAWMRHSVATAAINDGQDPALVASFLGHRSARTTRRFYATLATPAKVPTLL